MALQINDTVTQIISEQYKCFPKQSLRKQKWSYIREGAEEKDICTLDLAWEVSNTDDGGDAGDTYQ